MDEESRLRKRQADASGEASFEQLRDLVRVGDVSEQAYSLFTEMHSSKEDIGSLVEKMQGLRPSELTALSAIVLDALVNELEVKLNNVSIPGGVWKYTNVLKNFSKDLETFALTEEAGVFKKKIESNYLDDPEFGDYGQYQDVDDDGDVYTEYDPRVMKHFVRTFGAFMSDYNPKISIDQAMLTDYYDHLLQAIPGADKKIDSSELFTPVLQKSADQFLKFLKRKRR